MAIDPQSQRSHTLDARNPSTAGAASEILDILAPLLRQSEEFQRYGPHGETEGPVDYIIVTNRDHAREAVKYQGEYQCQLHVPEADAPQMDLTPTKTFKDGELLTGGIWVIQLKDQKSPGESALFIQQGKGVLIVGDALIGKPSGSVSLMPAERYADAGKAREGLRRLLKYNFDSLLVGDGASIVTGAKQAVERLLQPTS